MLFDDLNSYQQTFFFYQQNIKLTVKVNALNFLDTNIISEKESIKMQDFNKWNDFPLH